MLQIKRYWEKIEDDLLSFLINSRGFALATLGIPANSSTDNNKTND